MKTIDLNKIIEDKGLDVNELSQQLFPEHKHPRLALNRVISGDSTLNADQISKLSALVDIEIGELFEPSNWRTVPMNVATSEIVFENGDYKAVLNIDTMVTRIMHKKSLIHEQVLSSNSITLNEYLTQLNNIILKSQKS